MTRIVLDPPELQRVASHAAEAASFYATEGLNLEHPVLPEMPSHVVTNVSAGLDRVGARLRVLGTQLDAEAFELRLRSAIASEDPWAFAFVLWRRWLGMIGAALFPELPASNERARLELKTLLDRSAPPSEIHGYLASLEADQRAFLVRSHPELIGSLAGAPVEMRYEANRILIRRAIAALEKSRAGLVEQVENLDGIARELVERYIAEIDVRLAAWREWASPARQILVFDPWGDGRVVEAYGDLDRAAHVAVLVPGMGSDITNFDGVSGNALAVYREAELLSEAPVGAIAWLGYDAPDWYASALMDGAARDGAPALSSFVEGIEAGGEKHVTVVGHSYGSLVAGLSVRQERLDVEDVVFVGSPGVGVNDRDDLGSGFDVWAAKSSFDPIAFAPAHGEDPSAEGFGANRFETGSPGGLTQRHSSYFSPSSLALRNIALIVADLDDFVERL